MTIAEPSAKNTKPSATRAAPVVEPNLAAIIRTADAPVAVAPPVEPPPSMPGLQGLVSEVSATLQALRRGVASYVERQQRYGDVYRVPFLGHSLVCVWDPDAIHAILKNEDQIWSTAMGWDTVLYARLDPGANVGTLFSLDFEAHRAARKLVQPGFTLRAVEGYLEAASPRVDQAITTWLERGRVEFKKEARTLLGSIANEILTGIRDPEQVALVDRSLAQAWRGMMALSRHEWLSPTLRRARRGFKTLLTMFRALVPERRANGGNDLFSHLCQAPLPEGVDDDAMVRVFLAILFGAFDTTSAGLTSMAYHLATHPDWQERLRTEARTVPDLDVKSLKSLRQLDWAWKETLRLTPVTSFVPRRALRDTEIGGHAIAAGTLVAPMAAGIGRHPEWWTTPTVFDPERFSPERAEDKRHPSIFVPFGAGAHACVGMQLANLEVSLFWHKMLTRCRFSLTKSYDAQHTDSPLGCVSGSVGLTLERI